MLTNRTSPACSAAVAVGACLFMASLAFGQTPIRAATAQPALEAEIADQSAKFLDEYVRASENVTAETDEAKAAFFRKWLAKAKAAAAAEPQSGDHAAVLGVAATLARSLKDYPEAESLALAAAGAAPHWTMKSYWLRAAGSYARSMSDRASTVRAAAHLRDAVSIAFAPERRGELQADESAAVNASTAVILLSQTLTSLDLHTEALEALTQARTRIQAFDAALRSSLARSNHGVEGLAGMEVEAAARSRNLPRGREALQALAAVERPRTPASMYAERFAALASDLDYAQTGRDLLRAIPRDGWTAALELRIAINQAQRQQHGTALAEGERLLRESLEELEAIDVKARGLANLAPNAGGNVGALYGLIGSTSVSQGNLDRGRAMLALLNARFPDDPQTRALADQIAIFDRHAAPKAPDNRAGG